MFEHIIIDTTGEFGLTLAVLICVTRFGCGGNSCLEGFWQIVHVALGRGMFVRVTYFGWMENRWLKGTWHVVDVASY